MEICSCCFANPRLAKKIPFDTLDMVQNEYENYCAHCLPFENAEVDAHNIKPNPSDYLFVLDSGTWYIAYVKDFYNDASRKCRVFNLLYCSETGKGRPGQIILRGTRWYALENEHVHRINIWRNNKNNKWWRKQWKSVYTDSS